MPDESDNRISFTPKVAGLVEQLPDLGHRQSVLSRAMRSLQRKVEGLVKTLESDECTARAWKSAQDEVKALLSESAYEALIAPHYYRIATPTLVELVAEHLRPATKSQPDPIDARGAISKIAGNLGVRLSDRDMEQIESALLKGGAKRGAWELVSKITGESSRRVAEHCKDHKDLL